MQSPRARAAGRVLRLAVLVFALSATVSFAHTPAQIASAIREALSRCGEFKTAGYDFVNYRDPEGVVWPAGRQQDVYIFQDVHEDRGMLGVTEWIGHRRDFQPYGSRTRASGYIERMTARVSDIASSSVVELKGNGGVSRGLYGVRLACSSGSCFRLSKQTLFPADVTDVFTPLVQWRPTGGETQSTTNAWTFEVCAGAGGGTSQENANELQKALQLLLR